MNNLTSIINDPVKGVTFILSPVSKGILYTLPSNLENSETYIVVENQILADIFNKSIKKNKVIYIDDKSFLDLMISQFKNGEPTDLNFAKYIIMNNNLVGSWYNYLSIELWKFCQRGGYIVPRLIMWDYSIEKNIDPEFSKIANIVMIKNEREGIKNFQKTPDFKKIIEFINEKINNNKDNILIIVPSISYGDNLKKKIEGQNILLIDDNVDDIINYLNQKKRKIIICTQYMLDILRNQDIGIIIDIPKISVPVFNHVGTLSCKDVFVTKREIKIRDQLGSLNNDYYHFILISKSEYESLDETRERQIITSVPIEIPILKLSLAGLDPIKIFKEINLGILELSMTYLKHINAISGGLITKKGRFMLNFNYGYRLMSILFDWISSGYPYMPCVAFIAMINNFGREMLIYENVSDSKKLEHKRKYYDKFIGFSDIDTMLNMWLSLYQEIKCPYSKNKTIALTTELTDDKMKSLISWCNHNKLNINVFINIIDDFLRIMSILKLDGYDSLVGPFDVKNVIKSLQPIIKENYPDNLLKLREDRYVNVNNDNISMYLNSDFKTNLNYFFSKLPTTIVSIVSDKKIIRISLDIDDRDKVINPNELKNRALELLKL